MGKIFLICKLLIGTYSIFLPLFPSEKKTGLSVITTKEELPERIIGPIYGLYLGLIVLKGHCFEI